MCKKFSNRLSGRMANSWYGTPFRHVDAVELYRTGGQNRASSMQSEKSRKSDCEFVIIYACFEQRKAKCLVDGTNRYGYSPRKQ